MMFARCTFKSGLCVNSNNSKNNDIVVFVGNVRGIFYIPIIPSVILFIILLWQYRETDIFKYCFYQCFVHSTLHWIFNIRKQNNKHGGCYIGHAFKLQRFSSAYFLKDILTLSWPRSLSYRNLYIDFHSKLTDWFLYDRGLHHERVIGH